MKTIMAISLLILVMGCAPTLKVTVNGENWSGEVRGAPFNDVGSASYTRVHTAAGDDYLNVEIGQSVRPEGESASQESYRQMLRTAFAIVAVGAAAAGMPAPALMSTAGYAVETFGNRDSSQATEASPEAT